MSNNLDCNFRFPNTEHFYPVLVHVLVVNIN